MFSVSCSLRHKPYLESSLVLSSSTLVCRSTRILRSRGAQMHCPIISFSSTVKPYSCKNAGFRIPLIDQLDMVYIFLPYYYYIENAWEHYIHIRNNGNQLVNILTLRTLMSTPVDILGFYWHLYNQLLKLKCAFNFDIYWDLNFTNNTNFQSLEVVDRGSETQPQVTENLNWIAQVF